MVELFLMKLWKILEKPIKVMKKETYDCFLIVFPYHAMFLRPRKNYTNKCFQFISKFSLQPEKNRGCLNLFNTRKMRRLHAIEKENITNVQ